MEETIIRNIAIVSLSRVIIGEPDVQFEVETGLRHLNEYVLNVKFLPHALSGLEYVKEHPEKRVEEYKQLLVEAIGRRELPVLFNINVGHALSRCIIPFGVNADVDTESQRIRFCEG